MRPTWSICYAAVFPPVMQALAQAPQPLQVPLKENDHKARPLEPAAHAEKRRTLHGRFLHVTDLHPDPYYRTYSSTSEDGACHRGQGVAGIYGAEKSDCDSPFALVNETMDFISKNLKDKIDFVIWTGDSARHDNDEAFPRNKDQVLELNRFMVQKMNEAFGKHHGKRKDDDPNNDFVIPIVPNLGNNDILPHNILAKGPNQWTRAYSKLWRQFIPEAQQHSFQQGGWFYVEVIPNKLAVFSLNTMYFFTSNSAADGCAARSEPGYQQMEWLRIQLQFMRDRGVKAILIGHVPPVRQEAKTSWDETCWQKYTLWLRQYRDVIVSAQYGHFNYDHFMFQDFRHIKKNTKRGIMWPPGTERQIDRNLSTQVKAAYFIQLRDEWSELPEPPKSESEGLLDALWRKKKGKKDKKRKKQKKYLEEIGGQYAERFALSLVSASVVPNLFPTLRVFEYNTTGLDHAKDFNMDAPVPAPHEEVVEISRPQKKRPKKYKFKVPDAPSKSTPPGPAYSPQTLSLIRYTQYFANLTHINNDNLTAAEDSKEIEQAESAGLHMNKHKGKKPRPKTFKYEKLYDTKHDDVYRLDDLTMPNLIDLARRIGHFVAEEEAEQTGKRKHKKGKKKKKKKKKKHEKENEAWYAFIRRAFVHTLTADEIDEEFGQ